MAYANVNYELIAEIIRRVTGDTLARRHAGADLRAPGHGAQRDRSCPTRCGRPSCSERPICRSATDGRPDWRSTGELIEDADAGGAGGVRLAQGSGAVRPGRSSTAACHDGTRILAPSSVRAMTTNQIPGTPARFGPDDHGAGGVVGLRVLGHLRAALALVRRRPRAHRLGHPSRAPGGVNYWIDVEHEIVGVFFEILTEMSELLEPISGLSHRFQDVITGAVVE